MLSSTTIPSVLRSLNIDHDDIDDDNVYNDDDGYDDDGYDDDDEDDDDDDHHYLSLSQGLALLISERIIL